MLPIPGVEPSGKWSEAWLGFELRERSRERAPSTIRNRQTCVMTLAKHMTDRGITDPCSMTKAMLAKYLLEQYEGRKPGGKVIIFGSLKSFFDWFATEYEVPNPMTGVERPKNKPTLVPVVLPEQWPGVVAACKDKTAAGTARNVAMVWLMMESGLRRFEITGLDLDDVDLKKRTVDVRLGKGGKSRTSVFGDESAQALWRWLKHRGREPGPLFTSAVGGRLTASGLSQVLSRVKRRSGVYIRPHLLRHSWAHYALASGIGERNLMELAGWSTPGMLSIYGASLARERAIAAGLQVQVGQVMKGK